MKTVKKIAGLLLGIFITLSFMTRIAYADTDPGEYQYKVLYISSYSENFITNPDELEGIRSVFDPVGIDLDTEFMDTKRFPEQENTDLFLAMLKYKLEHTYTYDAVIISDDAALQFVMDHQEELFPKTPVFFVGINDHDRAYKASLNPYMTGIYEKASLKDNIDLALRMIPDADEIVGIVDGTVTGIGDEKQFMEIEAQYPSLKFTLLRSSDYSFDKLKEKLGTFGSQTIILFFTMSMDKDGNYFDMNEQFAFVSENTNVPVFRISVGGVGKGFLGGKLIDYREFGVRAANTLLDVFGGVSIETIPLDENTPYYYIFDQNIIDKYKIDSSKIPKEATIINQELRPWEQYRNYFIVIGVVFVLLAIFVFILIIDNMKRRKIQKEISVLYQKYETAIYGTNSAVWELHLDSMTVETSRNFEEIFGKKIPYKGEMHEILEKLTDNDHGRQIIEAVQEYMKGEQTEINLRIPLADDREEQRWILIRGSGVYDLNGTLTDMTGIFLDITSEKVKENYIAYFAKHDFLTGLPNRMDFEETLQKELDAGNSGVLMLFDVDDFKSINDTLGHAFGDEILKQVADRLKNLCTGDRYVARMGGDEFLLILRNAKEKEDVLSCLEDINRVIADVFCYDEIEEYISFSAGITFYPKDNNNINQLMMNADAAMYRVKRSGKNNYQFYYEEMKRELKEKKEIETVLRQAVKEGTFELYYQPQVDAETGVINGFEALIRIKDFHVSPGVFIPIAEETGDIIEIGRWVAKEAISQMAEWKKKGFPEKRIAINYSAKQMRDKGYLSYVNQLLQEYEIDPQNIEIEITEGILLEKTEATMEFLKRIRSMGMRLALDDFGSGYSSLSYLTFIPVNKIKLDKSINDKFLDIDNMRVMESIISLAHSLELTITAEGIEDRDKFLKLKQCGCDMIQGYLFDRPMPAEKLEGIYNQVYGV